MSTYRKLRTSGTMKTLRKTRAVRTLFPDSQTALAGQQLILPLRLRRGDNFAVHSVKK
ncbi:MAG: hypothetical protein LBT09_09630 [Planctomycetaceae bacterium]|nr:hypothetical protein [Planctomycetaceae bacterium]